MQPNALDGIVKLSITERIQLVEDIWDTIATHPDGLTIPDVQAKELDRRLDAYRQDPQRGSSWQDVQKRIQKTP